MKEDGGEEVEEGGEGRGLRGRVAKVTKDPQVRTLQQFVRAETEKSQATPAQKSQVTPDRSHKRPLYLMSSVVLGGWGGSSTSTKRHRPCLRIKLVIWHLRSLKGDPAAFPGDVIHQKSGNQTILHVGYSAIGFRGQLP